MLALRSEDAQWADRTGKAHTKSVAPRPSLFPRGAVYSPPSRHRFVLPPTTPSPIRKVSPYGCCDDSPPVGGKAIPFEVLKNATLSPHIDPLNAFSSRCRDELQSLLGHK
jgi:hypothetical protein